MHQALTASAEQLLNVARTGVSYEQLNDLVTRTARGLGVFPRVVWKRINDLAELDRIGDR